MHKERLEDIGEKELINRLGNFMPKNQVSDDCALIKTKLENLLDNWAISGKDEGMKDQYCKPVKKMIELFENKYENPSIIDAGCGNGWLIRHFYENKRYTNLTGVDGSREMIAKAKTLDNQNNYICSELNLWKPENKVDVVISMEG